MSTLDKHSTNNPQYAQNTLIAFSSTLCSIFSLALLSLIIGNYFGANGLGIFSLAWSLYNTIALIGIMGINQALIKYSAHFQNDIKNLSTITSSSFLLSLLFGFISSFILYSSSKNIALFFSVPELENFTSILAFGYPFFFLNKCHQGLFNGLQLMKYYFLVDLIRYFSLLCGTLFLVLNKESLNTLAFVILFTEFIALIIAIFLSKRLYRFTLKSILSNSKILIKFGSLVSLSGFIGEINTRVDLFIVGYFLDTSSVGVYSVALMIARGVLLIPSAIQRVTGPNFSYLYSRQSFLKIIALANHATKYSVILISLIAIFIGASAEYFIPIVYPGQSNFINSIIPLKILLIGIVFQAAIQSIGSIHSALGRPEVGLMITIPYLLSNMLLNVLLVPLFGLIGSAIATTLVFIFGLFYRFYLIKTVLKLDITLFPIIKPILIGAMLLSVTNFTLIGLPVFFKIILSISSIIFCLYFFKIIDRNELNRIKATLRNK